MLLVPPPAIVLLTGAEVWLDDGKHGEARASQTVAIQGSRIAAVGPEDALAQRFPKATRVDLKGGTLLPAFTEGHAHVNELGATGLQVRLGGATDAQEAVRRVKTWAAAHGTGWVLGRGWDQNRWPGKAFPSARDLDEATGGRPALLARVDGHAVWVNSAALRLAGLSRATPDPKGGQILRDPRGEPTGILVDAAVDLVAKLIPEPSQTERREILLEGLRQIRDEGCAAVADMGIGRGDLEAYRALAAENALPIRVFAYLSHDPKLMLQELKKPRKTTSAFFQVQGVKFYLDGALGSRGARLFEPYADLPESRGTWVTEPARVQRDVAITLRAGYQPSLHAIGDAANQAALKVLESVYKGHPGGLRPRIEHAQIIAPADVPRFGKLGVLACMQPVHCTSDHGWTGARLGPGRIREAYPWRDLLRSGATLAFGSDAPNDILSPWEGLASAETRQDASGDPPGGWLPDQVVTREEALRAYTVGNAEALGRKDMGRIQRGCVADLLWVAAPIRSLTAGQLRKVRPARLWVNGKEVDLPASSKPH